MFVDAVLVEVRQFGFVVVQRLILKRTDCVTVGLREFSDDVGSFRLRCLLLLLLLVLIPRIPTIVPSLCWLLRLRSLFR